MAADKYKAEKKLVSKMLSEGVTGKVGNLDKIAQNILQKKDKIERLAKKYPTPFFAIDSEGIKETTQAFLHAFDKFNKKFSVFFAVKTNNHPEVLKRIIKNGLGMDVSSGWELERVLKLGAKKVVFTGPGKSWEELKLAVLNADRVIINIDSFRELEKLDAVTRKMKKRINAGVRLNTKIHGQWNKFGVPIKELGKFWLKASECKYINLQGVQAHMSKNKTVTPYVAFIKELAFYLKKDFTEEIRKKFKFVDVGGGFLPFESFAYYPLVQPQGVIIKTVNDYFGKATKFASKYFIKEAVPIEEYAKGISMAMEKYIAPLADCELYVEPGRFISHKAMLLVTRVVDVKSKKTAITDGGINMLGWERFESEYYPVVNLTHPSKKEMEFRLNGPLCTPLDHWGNYCYAKKVVEGDLVAIANQGAYSFTSAHNFIKPIPNVYVL